MVFHPSHEQRDMLGIAVEAEKNNFSFIAPAGCGKTSTILYFLDDLSLKNRLLVLTFNVAAKNEISQRLNYANNPFNNLNKENIEVLTFNGYMRKVLLEKIKDIVFDYKNGDFAPSHLKMTLANLGINYTITNSSGSVTESFNEYIGQFLKGITPLSDYFKQDIDFNINATLVKELDPIAKKLHGISLIDTPEDEIRKEIKNIYNTFADSIFFKNALNESMPHSIYYRYVYEHYKNENLFEGYDYIMVDEGQDIDLVIIELLTKSNIKIIKFGDDFQRINGFRGTINSLQDKNSIVKYLTMSYRLTPYLALLTSAYLKNQGTKLGIDSSRIPQVYGGSRHESTLKEQKVKETNLDDYVNSIIETIGNIKIEENDTYIEVMDKKKEVESSISKGCKSKFKSAIKDFKNTKDYIKFASEIKDYTTLLSSTNTKGKDYIQLLADEEKNNDKLGEIHNKIYQIFKAYTMRFSKKEKLELLENDNYAFLFRGNAKVIDSAYKFIENIPYEPLSDISLFNIKINSTLVSKFDDILKGNFISLRQQEKAIFFQGMEKIIVPKLNMNIQTIMDALSKSKISEKILEGLMTYPLFVEKYVCAEINNGSGHLLKDYGVTTDGVRNAMKKAIQQTKKDIDTDEVTAKDIIECGHLNSLQKFVNYGAILTENFSLEDIQNVFNPFVENFYKYCKIKEANKYNSNISLVSDKGVANVFFSTGHQSKGLEFKNVFIGNDIYYMPEDRDVDQEEEIAEFNLAYVCMTRSKGKLFIEQGSSLYEQIKETVNKGFSRSYISNNIIITENLSDTPSLSAKWLDKDKEIKTEKIIFLDNGKFPCYKDVFILSDLEGAFHGIGIKGQKNETNNLVKTYLKPIKPEEELQLDKQWKNENEKHKQELQELMIEADGLF